MPTESDLRDRMRQPRPGGSGGLDAASVVRAARRRRRPKVLLAGAAAFAVAAAIVVPAAALGLRSSATSSAGSAVDSQAPSREQSTTEGAGPNAVGQDPCLDAPAPTTGPVSARLDLDDAAIGADGTGTLLLGTSAGATLQPTGTVIVLISRGGAVVGQGSASVPDQPLALSPGAETTLSLSFTPLSCGMDTALPAGDYSAQALLLTASGDAVASSASVPFRIG